MARKTRKPQRPNDKKLALAIEPYQLEARYASNSKRFEYVEWKLRIVHKDSAETDPGVVLKEPDLIKLRNPRATAVELLLLAAKQAEEPDDSYLSAENLCDAVGKVYDACGVRHSEFTPQGDLYHWISDVRKLLESLPSIQAMAKVAEVEPFDMAHTVLFGERTTGYRFIFPSCDIQVTPSRFFERPKEALSA